MKDVVMIPFTSTSNISADKTQIPPAETIILSWLSTSGEDQDYLPTGGCTFFWTTESIPISGTAIVLTTENSSYILT